MTRAEISAWVNRMMVNHSSENHSSHVWAWLNYNLKLWGEKHPLRVVAAPCEVCAGRRWLICERSDGRQAVERCDECSWFGDDDPRTFSDPEAADLARAAGVACEAEYPCYLISGANP